MSSRTASRTSRSREGLHMITVQNLRLASPSATLELPVAHVTVIGSSA